MRTSLEKGNDDSCGETEQGQHPQHMEKPVIVFICSPPRPCVCGVCVCEGGLSFSQVLGGTSDSKAWSQVAHPEQQQCPGHHSAEQQNDPLRCDDVVLGGLPHVQEGFGGPLCERRSECCSEPWLLALFPAPPE